MGVILDSMAKAAGEREFQKKYDRDLPIYTYYYSFVPNYAINDVITSVRNSSMMAMVNNGYSSAAEAKAVTSLRDRKDSELDTAAPPTTDINELLYCLEYWEGKQHRPELISKRLFNTLAFCSKAIPSDNLDKAVKRIIEATNKFHYCYLHMIDKSGKSLQATAEWANDYYVTGETTGLGYGIITNSISHALLYEAMDRKERDRQYGAQIARAHRVSESVARDRRAQNLSDLKSFYGDYIKDIKSTVKEAFSYKKSDDYDPDLKMKMNGTWLPVKEVIDQEIKKTKETQQRILEEERKKAARSTPEAKKKRKIIYSTIAAVIIVISAFLLVLGNNNKNKAYQIEKALPNHTYISSSGEITIGKSYTDSEVHIGDRYYDGYVDTDSSPLGVYFVFNWRHKDGKYSSTKFIEVRMKIVEINEKNVPTKLKLDKYNAFETEDLEFVLK